MLHSGLRIDRFDKLLHASVHNHCRAVRGIIAIGNVYSANASDLPKVVLGKHYLFCNFFLEPDDISICQSAEISSTSRAFSLAALVACFMKSSAATITISSNLPANSFSDFI